YRGLVDDLARGLPLSPPLPPKGGGSLTSVLTSLVDTSLQTERRTIARRKLDRDYQSERNNPSSLSRIIEAGRLMHVGDASERTRR
ncbi:hypothetical protein, partial [Bradyrhizobium sp. UBA2491]|uniref:hypothetical protein n=1 Tax=Bradyrhizobium sp. UBA2491 TaxID=1946119 RepID=UPI0025BC917A